MKHVVTIGGGTGHARALAAFKQIPGIAITGVCPSTDSGGSTGVLQRAYGGNGYLGDLTKCFAALADDPALAKALSYRFAGGPLDGHSAKNVLFLALEKTGSLRSALESMRKLCGLGPHRVLPVTEEKTELCAELKIGNRILGETNIDNIAKNPLWNPDMHAIANISLSPDVYASKEATDAVRSADHVAVCPGDLYSSIIPVLLPHGMRQAFRDTRAEITVFVNVMTKIGETHGYAADDFLEKIEERLGRRADNVVCNDAPVPEETLARYSLERKVELAPFRDRGNRNVATAPLATVDDAGQVVSDIAAMRAAFEKILSA